jgi:CxxC motif-containing protein (DUF1111 family)
MRAVVVITLGAAVVFACGSSDDALPPPPSEPVLSAPFGEPRPGIDTDARARFDRGRAVFMRRFVPSGGLGPEYNAVACFSCHEKPVAGGGASRYRGVYVESEAKDDFIVQFAHHFTTIGVPAKRPPKTATHIPPAFFGAGLVAEIPAEEISSRADPSDIDGDGISGKVNFERGFVGRFGRKSQMASLQGFIRLALLDHLGVTTTPVPTPDIAVAPADGPVELPTKDGDGVPDPEISQADLGDLISFVALLAPPAPDPPTPQTKHGESVFESTGCTACHVPTLQSPRGPLHPYSDLLLHDMGPELGDGVSVGEARANEFRTQPLWGLGVAGPFLHDGRADTIDEAIRAHAGEGQKSKEHYDALSPSDRDALIAFLRSLGGSDRRPDGLLSRDAPVLPVGEFGGPIAPLSPDDTQRFIRGRELFDHDFARSQGLGSRFNGDACRSCHFDPVIGGAGGADLDVVRYGFHDGVFHPPASGDTMASHFDLTGTMPVTDANANLFERRQTPAIFGLGLIDLIADDVLLARADPDDKNGDGIRGVVARTADGKIGRFGWKGQQPTLADFTRDAFKGELGIESQELPPAISDMDFFLAELAPPPRKRTNVEEEDRGSAVFAKVGCAACHAPELPARDGRPVRLFSDLLLHDVAPKEAKFVVQGSERTFRTPPLWGLASTAPYFHDGLAETIEVAVRRHDGEAAKSRDAFIAATDAERSQLLAFLRSL